MCGEQFRSIDTDNDVQSDGCDVESSPSGSHLLQKVPDPHKQTQSAAPGLLLRAGVHTPINAGIPHTDREAAKIGFLLLLQILVITYIVLLIGD